MTSNELKNKLYKECGLTADDIFDSGQYKIITRSGIEKIQYANDINVVFEPVLVNLDQVVIRGTFQKKEKGQVVGMDGKAQQKTKTIQTFGEWNKTHIKYKKTKDGTELGNYPIPFYSVALAEKRCLSRGVLKIMGLYEHGVMGEDETIYDEPSDATPSQIDHILRLLESSTLDERQRAKIERECLSYTQENANACITMLQANQLDQTERSGYNQGDIQKKLNYID
jgi:hypothetical protein